MVARRVENADGFRQPYVLVCEGFSVEGEVRMEAARDAFDRTLARTEGEMLQRRLRFMANEMR